MSEDIKIWSGIEAETYTSVFHFVLIEGAYDDIYMDHTTFKLVKKIGDDIDILLELEWIKLGRRRQSPGRPVTFIVTQVFLDHFGMESSKDLPGIKELRDAGLLDNRPPPGSMTESNINDFIEDDDQEDMFE